MEGEASQQAPAQQAQPPQPSRSTQELAEDGQKQLEAVVEAAHDILLTLNRALCSPSFWVAPSSQPALAQEINANANANANAASGGSDGGLGLGDGAAAGKEKGADDGEGLAALDATRVRYKNATAALRATVAAIVKAAQVMVVETLAFFFVHLLFVVSTLSCRVLSYCGALKRTRIPTNSISLVIHAPSLANGHLSFLGFREESRVR